MRKDNSKYKKIVVKEDHPFFNSFQFDTKLNKQVTFSPNMILPFHRWFYYKPGFSCGLIESIYKKYFSGNQELSIYDPFCGVGTTPIWAAENGHLGYGSDVSPLAIFISNCKCIRDISQKNLSKSLDDVLNSVVIGKKQKKPIDQREIPYYIEKGFSKKNKEALLAVIENISDIDNENNKKIILLALMKAAYDVSLTKKDGGFLRYIDESRYDSLENRLKFHVEDILRDFNSTATLFDFNGHQAKKFRHPKFFVMDARNLSFRESCFDLVITSPPYLNRYDYTRIYAIELSILGLSDKEIKKLRKKTIKSHTEADYQKSTAMKSKIFDDAYNQLLSSKLSNIQIPEMVNGYYNDMASTLNELKKVTRKDGIISFVVGNSRFSGIHFETDAIISEIGTNLGLTLDEILVTKCRGSSAQQVNKYGDLPLRESIVTLRK